MFNNFKIPAAATALAMAAAPMMAGASEGGDSGRIEIGYLVCNMTSQDAGIILSEQEFLCNFDPADDSFSEEKYIASFEKVGIDLSATEAETLRWAVLAPAEKHKDGVLEGKYAGVSADIAVGAGIGAKALVGGLEESVALQPVSVTTQTGLGVSVGIETLTLTQAPNS